MDQQVSSNFVPIEAPTEEIKSEEPQEGDYNKNLEKDLVQFLQEEFKENTNGEFWKYVRDFANGKLGEQPTDEKITPMTDEQVKKFAKQSVPWGRFEGQLVATVVKKDLEFLKRMAVQPLMFQKQLKRYLASVKEEKKEKSASK